MTRHELCRNARRPDALRRDSDGARRLRGRRLLGAAELSTAAIVLAASLHVSDPIDWLGKDVSARLYQAEVAAERRLDALGMDIASLWERIAARPEHPGEPVGAQHR